MERRSLSLTLVCTLETVSSDFSSTVSFLIGPKQPSTCRNTQLSNCLRALASHTYKRDHGMSRLKQQSRPEKHTGAEPTRQAKTSRKNDAAPTAPTPLIVALTKLLHKQGQPTGQLSLVSESPVEIRFRWQVQQNTLRPCHTAQIWRPTLAGHKSNGAWVSVDNSGSVHLTCLHSQCQARGRSNRRLLGFVPLSALHFHITTSAEDANSNDPSPTCSLTQTNGSATRKISSTYPADEEPASRHAKARKLGHEPTSPSAAGQPVRAKMGCSRVEQHRNKAATSVVQRRN